MGWMVGGSSEMLDCASILLLQSVLFGRTGNMWICVLFASLVILTAVRAQHKCYVCVPPKGSREVERLFPNTKLAICGESLDVKVCPKDYESCLTQTRSNQITRTCGNGNVEECKMANGVQFCYCKGQLCNIGNKSPYKPPSDDEDIGEGSGADATVATTQILLPKHTTVTPTVHGGMSITTSSVILVVLSVFSFYVLC